MTLKTRRRVLVCVVAVVLTLPLELVLLQAMATTSSQEMVQQWVGSLSEVELGDAADQVRLYPVAYRREIMRALAPERRAEAWRAHIQSYIATHPELDSSALPVLEAAMAMLSADMFENPTDATRAQARVVAEQTASLLGKDTADYLLSRLGPRDGTFASIQPWQHRLASKVRGWLVAVADVRGCDCNVSFGCDGYSTICKENTGCPPDTEWPMCGWFWNETCDGLCWATISD